jgi:hypothetical protein
MMIPYSQLDPNSRVWVYTSKHNLQPHKDEIEAQLATFATDWTSHQQTLLAWAGVVHDHFICLAVDNRSNQASGCSIDKSVAFLKNLENQYQTTVLDGQLVATFINNAVQVFTLAEFRAAYQNGHINNDTLVFDTLIDHKTALDTQFIKPLGQSWHKRLVKQAV